MSRTSRIIAGGAVAAGLTLGVAAIASAGTSSEPDAAAEFEVEEIQEPKLNGSVKAPAEVEGQSEADEAKWLESLARISPDQAVAAATEEVSGAPGEAELENENGVVVYEVEVTGADGTETEVKVDAGDGAVLDIEDEGAEEEGDDEAEEEDESDDDDDDDDGGVEDDEGTEGAAQG